MKIAISGKGGVGKTTLAAFLIKSLQQRGMSVLAIDADPDANLAQALGAKNAGEIIPISEMKPLIEERTETKIGTMGGFFKMNPKVDYQEVNAFAPLATLFGYATDIRSLTQGRGTFTMEFNEYCLVPPKVASEILEKYGYIV